MAVRNAKFVDVPALVRFLLDCHARSIYAGTVVEVDTDEAKRLLVASIQRHGGKHGGSCFVQVAEGDDGNINGLILSTMVRVYAVGNKLRCTDLFWATGPHAAPGDAMTLMRNSIQWAKSVPHCVEVQCGITTVISENPATTSRFLKTLGMKDFGLINRLELGEEKCLVSSDQ